MQAPSACNQVMNSSSKSAGQIRTPSALFSGVLTASAILKRNLMGTIAKEENVRNEKTEYRAEAPLTIDQGAPWSES